MKKELQFNEKINCRIDCPAYWIGWFRWAPGRGAKSSLGHIIYDSDRFDLRGATTADMPSINRDGFPSFTACGRELPAEDLKDHGFIGLKGVEVFKSKTWAGSVFVQEFDGQCLRCLGMALQWNWLDLDSLIKPGCWEIGN